MSLSTNSERSDHEPPPIAGLRSPLYGTATFTTLSPSSTPAPLSSSGASSTRLSPPSRSATPITSDDGTYVRRDVASPTASSFDSRRYTDDQGSSQSYMDENDNSFDETAEVEEVLSRIDDEVSQISREDNFGSGYSSSSHSSSYGPGPGSQGSAGYVSGTEPLNFDRERRVLSIISERSEAHSLGSGTATSTGLFQNLFASTFSRPATLFSTAARSFYGAPPSPLSPPSSIPTLQNPRPATPERTFRPVPPSGRRVGDLVASFESSASDSDISSASYSRPGSVPLGPRSPSPYSSSSRSISPIKHSRSGSTGLGLGLSSASSASSQSISSYLSPPTHSTAFSRSYANRSSDTATGSATERPRSPLSSVRNIVDAWKERSPEKASVTTRSAASSSIASGPSFTSASASSAPFGFGNGFFSLRRRATLTASSNGGRRLGNTNPPSSYDSYDESASDSIPDTRSLARSSSHRSAGGSSVFDMSELGSFVRGNQDALRIGQLWYLNVHAAPPFRWQRCQAMLYPNMLLLTWIAAGGGRGVVTLDLVNCNEVRSVPSPSHPSARDDIGTVAARLQMDERLADSGDIGEYDLVEMLCPFQLLYGDGIERLGAESARERVRWVSAIWEALDRSVAPPDRSTTRSPTGSIRTIRSVTSSVVSSGSGSGSASTTYLPPMDSIPDLSDFDASSFMQAQSPRHSLSSFTSFARTRATDDGAISSRDGLLHPFDARSIEIAPSRSSSLRRTSSLADLDAEFASALSASGISFDSRTRSRGGSSRFSARWTRGPSEYSSSIGSSEIMSELTRRTRPSTFYSSSGSSQPTFRALDSSSSTITPTHDAHSTLDSDTGTQVVPSTLSLRRSASNSMLGDSHSGSAMTIETRTRSPTTPTRSSRSPESLYTTTSGTGLSRATAVRRRTPRAVRTYSGSTRSGMAQSSSDKENEQDEAATTGTWNACETSQWSTLDGGRSYTTTSYDNSRFTSTRTLSESGISTIRQVESVGLTDAKSEEGESEDDIFLTPTPSSRTATSYRSAPGTPTPSIPSLSSLDYETALKASSSEYATAELCSSEPSLTEYATADLCLCPTEPPSTEYTTADVCPSTPPVTETEYLTAECRCKPAEPAEEAGTLTPSLSLTYLPTEKSATGEEVISLYAPSTVPTVLSSIEEAAIQLPESETQESPSLSVTGLDKGPSMSAEEPSSIQSSESPAAPPTPVVVSPTPSLSTSDPSTPADMTTSTTESSTTPTPSSPSSPSIPSIPLTPSSPSSPTSMVYKSESSMTPKSKSLYVPSHSSAKSEPSVSDGYDSSFLAPSPSLHSMSFMDPVDVSFGTSFLRPDMSELFSGKSSPFMLKGPTGISTTATPTSTTTNTTSSIEQTYSRSTTELATPSTVSSTSSMTMSSERSQSISSLTPSSALRPSTAAISERTPGASTLTASSTAGPPTIGSGEQRFSISSLTASSDVRPSTPGGGDRTFSVSDLTASSGVRLTSAIGTERTPSVGSLTASSAMHSQITGDDKSTATPSSLTPSSPLQARSASSVAHTTVPSSLTPSSAFDDESILGHTVTVTRTPSSVSSISTASMDSAMFAPESLYEESLATVPTLLSSRATTPRPMTPFGVPLPSSPSLTFASATPTASLSIGTPRSSAPSAHTMTSVATSDVIEQPREEILTHDVNRLLRYLHDLDQIRGGETQDMREQLQRIEEELRGLADYLHKSEAPKKEERVVSSIRPSGRRSAGPIPERSTTVRQRSLSPESLEYEPVPLGMADRSAILSESTDPLPVPEPHPQTGPERALTVSVHSVTPPLSPSYSLSTLSEGMSFLSSHHSDDFSLMSLEDYPAVPLSAPGSPSSPSSPGWSSSSTEAPIPPSSVTPSSDPRSSMMTGPEYIPVDLTPESPFAVAATPIPPASPLASLVSAESPMPLPPDSMTPSQHSATPLAVSPLPMESGSVRSLTEPSEHELSSATPPPFSSSSSLPSSSLPSAPSSPLPPSPAPSSVVPMRQPASPVLSVSPEPSEPGLPLSPEPPGSAVLHESPTPLPSPMLAPSPGPLIVTEPPSPAITVRPPSDRSGRSRALDGLRDLLEDLRGQTQALWDGQLATNRMLDDLVERRPPTVPTPEGNEEVFNRLHAIEGLLDGILRDLDRARLGGTDETAPSDIGSDTSSALRRYIDRLRDPRRHEPLHMPTPVRAPRADLDTEWLDFLSAPPPGTDQPIQGPPPIVPLVQRSARRPRVDSISPPLSDLTPVIRTRSVPSDERIRYSWIPRTGRPYVRIPPSEWSRQPHGTRGPITPEESGIIYDLPGSPWRAPRPRPPPTSPTPSFLRELRNRRRRRQPGDGFIDNTLPPPRAEQDILEEVPPAPPPRVYTAPPTGHTTDAWYPSTGEPIRPGQTMANVPISMPGAHLPQPQHPMPGAPMPATGRILMGGPPPPFNEMLGLLRQNRLAQTASIDQQREIMRYMRGLNQWLEHDVRDRQNEMRSIGARVDALRAELGRLGFPANGPVPVPSVIPQPQGPLGQTFIVPPLPQPQHGFVMSPGGLGGPPVIPMPQPGIPFLPGPQQLGTGPPVVPPLMPSYIPGGPVAPGGGFIPPRPEMADVPVIPPSFDRSPRPGMQFSPDDSYTDYRSDHHEPFIPPRPTTPSMMPVPPPMSYPSYTVPVEESSRSSPSRESRGAYSPPDIHIHVPPAPQAVTSLPSSQAPPPEVVRVEQPFLPGPLHPALSGMHSPQPTVLPAPLAPPFSQPIIIAPPPPTVPSAFPDERPIHAQPPMCIALVRDHLEGRLPEYMFVVPATTLVGEIAAEATILVITDRARPLMSIGPGLAIPTALLGATTRAALLNHQEGVETDASTMTGTKVEVARPRGLAHLREPPSSFTHIHTPAILALLLLL
ncbi:hypothetical protein M0805_004688 [Coniferiporia weirii]|nr:hypothetical protein M0805_004688 [Coniferiporia weirii]